MSEFKFKQFTIKQEKSGAKVGTDGVLLGCWANLDNAPQRILDVGAGTGVLSLILAQRLPNSLITAVEIEPNAAWECAFNFDNSPWSDRMVVKNKNFLDFTSTNLFDLIISNPPFFMEETPSPSFKRNLARSATHLPLKELMHKAKQHLSPKGSLQLILPYNQKNSANQFGKEIGLYPNLITNVKGNKDRPYKRVLISFKVHKSPITENELIIEEKRHQYTGAFKELVNNFYLKL